MILLSEAVIDKLQQASKLIEEILSEAVIKEPSKETKVIPISEVVETNVVKSLEDKLKSVIEKQEGSKDKKVYDMKEVLDQLRPGIRKGLFKI